MSSFQKPLQRIPYKEKVKDNNRHGKQTASYYLRISPIFQHSTTGHSTYNSKLQNYNILTNNVPEEWFHHIKNPLSSAKEEYKNFPAKIRPYNIIIPNTDLYMGEFIKRGFKYQTLNKSEEGYNSFIEEKTKALYSNVKQHYINSLVEVGALPPEDYKEVELPEELEKEFLSNFVEQIAGKGQNILEYIDHDKKTFQIFKECFYDWLAVGECHTYKNVVRDDIEYERVNPLEFYSDFSNNTRYGEDGNYTVRRQRVSLGDLIDNFYDEFTPEQVTQLEEELINGSGSSQPSDRTFGDTDKTYLYHITWKSLKIVKVLTYFDEMGQVQEMEVDEEYKADKAMGESTKEITINEWWETSFIPSNSQYLPTKEREEAEAEEGYQEGYYFRIRPIPVQRGRLTNSASCKGLYNSVYFKNENSNNTSIVELGKPYLILFIILNYKIELTIAKSKGKILLMDHGAIPRKDGWDEEKYFYYSEALGYMLIDRDQVGADKSFNQYSVLDMGLFQDIAQLIQIKDSIKNDYDELLGISRQRKGQISASETATGTTAARINSSVISEYLFDKFDDFRLAEYEGLLDMARFAYAKGKKALYIGSDGGQQLLNIVEGDLESTELGVIISRSAKDAENLVNFKQYAQSFAQNGATPSTVGKIIGADSLVEVTAILEGIEAKQHEREQASAKSEQEAEAMRKQTEQEFEGYKSMLRREEAELEHDRLDNREYIKGDIELSKQTNEETAANEDTSIEDIESRNLDRLKEGNQEKDRSFGRASKARELDLKEKEIKVKEKDSDNRLKIAKENKNRHDKK